jgi:enoyl-CoA hydratase/carnithine racemase
MSTVRSVPWHRLSMALFGLLIFSSTRVAGLTTLEQSCINEDCSAVRVSIHNPPVNLFDINVIADFDTYLNSLQHQDKTKVVVISSDLPGYFAAHLDLNLLSNVPRPGINASDYINKYISNIEQLMNLPVVFIGEINGRTWGAGNENAMRYDIRFAGPEAIFGAPEAAGGLLHFGGAQQLT